MKKNHKKELMGQIKMDAIIHALKIDLEDLFKRNEISAARGINESLRSINKSENPTGKGIKGIRKQPKDRDGATNEPFVSYTQVPMYFNGKYDSPTVLVMLNPGNAIDKCYDFQKSEQFSQYSDFDDFFARYIYSHENYGILDYAREDNFDLKQAAFLSGFAMTEFEQNCDFIQRGVREKLDAKCFVLMNKLQLELLPYCSRDFKQILKGYKHSLVSLDAFVPFVERLFDAIVEHRRENVIFCSRRFCFLFWAIIKKKAEKNSDFMKETIIDMETSDQKSGIKKNADEKKEYISTYRCVTIIHKGKTFHALVANTFASQALPNAYNMMKEYGKRCSEYLSEYKQRK